MKLHSRFAVLIALTGTLILVGCNDDGASRPPRVEKTRYVQT